MINQRAYPDIKLGNSQYTIATDGCYECALLRGLQLRGYTYTVKQFNQVLIDLGVFPKGSGLLSSSVIAQKVSSIFLEGRNEPWNDAKLIAYMSDDRYLIVGEVDGRGIGGTGQHFVYIRSIDVTNGQITMTWIDDPWDGLDNQKVTTRYNAYGNIKSLRVFKVNKIGNQQMPVNQYKPNPADSISYDLTNNESNKALADLHYNVVHKKTHISKTDSDKLLEDQKTLLENRHQIELNALTTFHDKYVTENAKVLAEYEELEKDVKKLLVKYDVASVKKLEIYIDSLPQNTGSSGEIGKDVKLSNLVSEVLRRLLAGDWR